MSRYEVRIVMTMEYTFAIEAPTPMDAQGTAFMGLPVATPQSLVTHIEVEEGVI